MENNLAVLIDFENIAAGTEKENLGRFDVKAVLRRLKDKGRIVVARAYADWGRFSRFKQTLLEEGVTMVELTSHGMQDKNRADIALAVEAMELAFTREYVNTFVLLSGDSDFTPLVLRLKELNKRVIGLGTRGSTSKLIVAACDEFIFYNSLLKPEGVARKPAPARAREEDEDGEVLDKAQAFALLEEALRGIQQDEPGAVLASVVKAALKRKEPAFNESDLGFSGFGRFLEAAQRAGIVSIFRDERSGGYRVDQAGQEVTGAPAPQPTTATPEPSLSAGAEQLRAALAGEGLDPLPRIQRKDLVQQVVDLEQERRSHKRKTNLQMIRSELVRRGRHAQSGLSPERIRAVLRALRESGVLRHSDGRPVRAENANFAIQPADADGVLDAMDRVYLRAVRAMNLERLDTAALAELLLGDPGKAHAVEEILAWLSVEEEVPEESETGETAPAAEE